MWIVILSITIQEVTIHALLFCKSDFEVTRFEWEQWQQTKEKGVDNFITLKEKLSVEQFGKKLQNQ